MHMRVMLHIPPSTLTKIPRAHNSNPKKLKIIETKKNHWRTLLVSHILPIKDPSK